MQQAAKLPGTVAGVDTLRNAGGCSVNIIDFGEDTLKIDGRCSRDYHNFYKCVDTLKNDGRCSNMTNLLSVDALKRG